MKLSPRGMPKQFTQSQVEWLASLSPPDCWFELLNYDCLHGTAAYFVVLWKKQTIHRLYNSSCVQKYPLRIGYSTGCTLIDKKIDSFLQEVGQYKLDCPDFYIVKPFLDNEPCLMCTVKP